MLSGREGHRPAVGKQCTVAAENQPLLFEHIVYVRAYSIYNIYIYTLEISLVLRLLLSTRGIRAHIIINSPTEPTLFRKYHVNHDRVRVHGAGIIWYILRAVSFDVLRALCASTNTYSFTILLAYYYGLCCRLHYVRTASVHNNNYTPTLENSNPVRHTSSSSSTSCVVRTPR